MRNKWNYPSHHSDLTQLRFKEKQMDYVLKTVQAAPSHDNTHPKKKIVLKRFGYFTTAAAALCMLIIGSTHFSLDMAKAAAKIPYFSLFIKQEEYKYALYDSIQDVINDHQYQVVDLDVSIPKKKITVSLLGSKEEVKAIKAEMIAHINEELVTQNFGKYKILVKKGKRPDPGPTLTQEEENYIADSVELEKKIVTLLAQHNYTPAFPVEARVNSMENFIYIALPNTENKQRVTELKELLHTVTKDYGEFRMRITSIDMKAREQELRWGNNIIGILAQGLMSNKSFQVTGFSYSFHPYPLQMKVKTSVQSTDPKAKELAEEILNEMKVFIQTHELTKDVRNDEYKVIIYGKDKEIIIEE